MSTEHRQDDLQILINNFLDAYATIDPTRILDKMKLHVLTHLPDDVPLFGVLSMPGYFTVTLRFAPDPAYMSLISDAVEQGTTQLGRIRRIFTPSHSSKSQSTSLVTVQQYIIGDRVHPDLGMPLVTCTSEVLSVVAPKVRPSQVTERCSIRDPFNRPSSLSRMSSTTAGLQDASLRACVRSIKNAE